MASVEFIQKRVAGKEKEIEKLEKKIERIRKAQASGWEDNPYYYNERDLKSAQKDLETATKALERYREDLEKETEKANSRNVKAIIDFLEGWKARVTEYYLEEYKKYTVARTEYTALDKELSEKWNHYRSYGLSDEERKEIWKRMNKERKAFRARWGFLDRYTGYGEFDKELFDKDIKNEADRKYDNIIERTNDITGTITDATGLKVGGKGELDGIVKGEKGNAKVQTIGAGGYNIQCFHFRVLVHKA